MIELAADIALPPIGPPPIGTELEVPPLRRAVAGNPLRRIEDHRAGAHHLRQGAGIILGVRGLLRLGDVACRLDESGKLPVGHRRHVDPEAVHLHRMRRRFLRIVLVRAHDEGATFDPDRLPRADCCRSFVEKWYLRRHLHAASISRRWRVRPPNRSKLTPFLVGPKYVTVTMANKTSWPR
ncbi:hypothetical protein D9M72_474280 [compost metagenome]